MPAVRSLRLFRQGVRELTQRPEGNVAALDVLRSVAIILVFSAHFAGDFQAAPTVAALPLFRFGWTGVDLFFVLSGLLIGTQLWREAQKDGRIQIGRFLLRRGLRIWPLYYAFIALMLAEIGFSGRPASGLWSDALFVSNYFHNQIGGSWSLSTEEQFYILAPVCIALAAWKIRPQRLWVLPVLGLVLPILSRAIAMMSSTSDPADLKQSLVFPIHTHADGLAIGLLLAWTRIFRAELVRSARIRLLGSTAMFVTGVALYAMSRVLLNFTSLALIYGAATLLGMTATTSRILNWHGFYLISRLSYGIYLNHFGLLPRMHAILGEWRFTGEFAFWACYLICFAASMVVAAVTFQLVEWPFLVLRSRWLAGCESRPRVQSVSSSPALNR